MAVTVRNSCWGGQSGNVSELLTAYIASEIRVLEADLQYAALGVQRDVPKGSDRLLFPQTNQLPYKMNININSSVTSFGSFVGGGIGGSLFGSQSSVEGQANIPPGAPVSSTAGVAAIVEGTNPTAVTWGATSYGSGPFQYGIVVQVSDLLVHNSAIEVVDSASMQVRNSLARLVDAAVQVVVNSGTNGVVYGGGKTSRSGLAAGDILTQTEMTKSVRNLRSANAAGVKPFNGKNFVAVIHPYVMADLMSNTQVGSWLDAARFTSVGDLLAGKVSNFRGVSYMESGNQQFYNSSTTVFPTTLVGDQSFGWGYFQQPTPILVSTPDSNNPLNLFTSIGGKVTLGVTRFEDLPWVSRIARVETAASA